MSSSWLNPRLKPPQPLARRAATQRELVPLNPNQPARLDVERLWQERLALLRLSGRITDTEVELLEGLARGLCNKEIAAARGVRPGTIKNELSTLFAKLGARSRTHAVCIVYGLA